MHISTLWSTWRKTSRFMLEKVTTLSPLWISVRHIQSVRWSRHWQLWLKTSHIERGTPRWTSGYDYWNHKDMSHSGCIEHTSRCGLQRNTDRVAAITAYATVDNLKQKREQTNEINILRGLPENAQINISMDVRCNSTTVKNSYGAGQAVSQAIGAAIEWQTDQHQLVGFRLENKLCKVGSMLRSQGHNVTCPGYERCSVTLRAVDPISEYDIGKQIFHSLAQDNVAIRYVVTDVDASASRGVQDAMLAVPTERRADTTHLCQTLFKHIMKASFPPPPPRMFPGETAIIRAENRRMSVKTRCQKIYTNVQTPYSSDYHH